MADLNVQSTTGAQLVKEDAAAGGDEFVNADGTAVLVEVDAGAGGPRTITLESQQTTRTFPNLGTGNFPSRQVVVNPGESAVLSGPRGTFGSRAQLTYSDAAADIKVAAFRLS